MLTFAVVASRAGGPISRPVMDRLRDPALPAVPFAATEHLVWTNDGATVGFGGWYSGPASQPAAHHWHVDSEGLAAFAGHVWPRAGGWPDSGPWAPQLAHHLRTQPLTAQTDDLAGVYVAASLARAGRSAVAADPLGFGLVYWGQSPGVTVISTRAELAAALLAAASGVEPERDAFGAAWLAYGTRVMGLRTGFAQVSLLPEGACMHIGATGEARLVRAARAPWLTDAELAGSHQELLEEARAEMVTSIRMALASGATATAGLTGGKDSRLILALLLAEGRADEVEFQTLGGPSLSDVVVATEIAERFGLRHTVNPEPSDSRAFRQVLDARIRAEGHLEMSAREISLRVGTWTASGARNIAKPFLGRPPAGLGVQLNGLCGETMRASWPSVGRFRSKVAAAAFPEHDLKFGSAGILRSEAIDRYREEVHQLLFADCATADSPQDVIDAFYMRHWFRRWFGNEQEFDSQGARFPLYSLSALRLAYSIGSQNRHAAWVHHELIRGACEPLLHLPFSKGGWPEGASGPLVPARRYDEPAPAWRPPGPAPASPKPADRTVFRDRRATLEAQDVEIMRRFLDHDRENPVFEILDPAATREALDRFATLPEREKLQLYGALTAAIWLGGNEIAPPEAPATQHP